MMTVGRWRAEAQHTRFMSLPAVSQRLAARQRSTGEADNPGIVFATGPACVESNYPRLHADAFLLSPIHTVGLLSMMSTRRV